MAGIPNIEDENPQRGGQDIQGTQSAGNSFCSVHQSSQSIPSLWQALLGAADRR